MKKFTLALMAGIFGASLLGLGACAGNFEYESGYGEENGGTPETDVSVFSPDGVLNESVYDSVGWLHVYCIDEDNARDLDRVTALASSAAQMNVTVFFRQSGMYAAVDVTNEPGKAAYVEPDRDESLNSGVELVFRGYKVKLSPAGSYSWQKKENGGWAAYAEAQAGSIGAQAKSAPLGEAGNTGYTMELFVPAANFTAMGIDYAPLASGEDVLPMDAVLVSSYAKDATQAARWELSSQLAWDDLYRFGSAGAETYSITVETSGDKGESMVAEAALRDYVLSGNDTTFLIKTAEGYRLKSFTVNDKAYEVTYPEDDLENGYVTLLTGEVTGDLHVKAEFEQNTPVAFEAAVEAARFGTQSALDGVSIVFERNGQRYTFDASEGRIAGRLPYGVYTVSVSDGLYDSMKVTFGAGGLERIRFTYRAFSSDKFGDGYGGYLDDSRANLENGYITNIDGNSFFPVTNETFGDSAFTVTYKRNFMSSDSSVGIRYLWDDKTNDRNMRNAVITELSMSGGVLYAGWADFTDNWNNYNVSYGADAQTALPATFAAAFTSGNGVSLTLVRTGATFDLYAAIAGNEASRIYVTSFSLGTDSALAAKDGYWAAYIWNSVNDIDVPVCLEESADDWKGLTYTVTETAAAEHGSVGYPGEEAPVSVGEPFTFTFEPEAGYALLSFTINGTEFISQVEGNTLTLTEAIPLSMTVQATFGKINYTIGVDLSGVADRVTRDDLSVTLTTGDGRTVSARPDGNVWKASVTAGTTYTYTVSAFGGYVLASGSVTAEENGTLDVSVAAEVLDLALADQSVTGSGELCGALGIADFVYSGYMGIEGNELENVSRFAAETQFTLASGETVQFQFVRWDNAYEIKIMRNDTDSGSSKFALTSDSASKVYDRVLQDDGVHFVFVVKDGVAAVWALDTDGNWVQLTSYDGETELNAFLGNSAVVKAEFRRRYSDGSVTAVLRDAEIRIGADFSPEQA